MTFTNWAKRFNLLGNLNLGVGIINIGIITVFIFMRVQVHMLLYIATVMSLICSWICFKQEENCKELAGILKEEKDELS